MLPATFPPPPARSPVPRQLLPCSWRRRTPWGFAAALSEPLCHHLPSRAPTAHLTQDLNHLPLSLSAFRCHFLMAGPWHSAGAQ